MITWSYIAQRRGVRHIGPMAQDFAAAFAVGENDTTINSIDADGVALAAIQGLNAKLERENAELRAALAQLRAQHATLAHRVERLLAADSPRR
jgi:trimeric autotransporter adhesin